MNTLELLEQDLILFEDGDVPNLSPSPCKDEIAKSINVPSFLEEQRLPRFQVANQLDLDNESPFIPNDLLNSTNDTGKELAEKVSKTNTDSYIKLPFWKLDITEDKMQLDFCNTEEYKTFVMHREPEEQTVIHKPKPKHSNITEESEEKGDEDNQILEEDRKRIYKLNISKETKILIETKYYRKPGHSDLENLRVYDKGASSLLYEMFCALFREKLEFEIEPVNNGKGPNEYEAFVVFNREKIVSGKGPSKQGAKGAASLNALQIFAPSLYEKLAKHNSKATEDQTIKELIGDVNKPAKVVREKSPEKPPKKKSDKEKIVVREIEEVEEVEEIQEIIEEEMFIKKTNPKSLNSKEYEIFDQTPSKLLDSLDSFGPFDMFLNERDDPLKNDIHTFCIDSDDDEKAYKLKKKTIDQAKEKIVASKTPTVAPPVEEKKDKFSIKCDSVNGIKIGMPLCNKDISYNTNLSEEIKTYGRNTAIDKVYADLTEILRVDKKVRVDPQASYNIEVGKSLKFYCANNVFTKLYMLHCLVNKKEDQNLQMCAIYYEGECHVSLYASELNQTFTYHSESFIMSIEMAKYFIVFSLYKGCRTVWEVLDKIKPRIALKKDNQVEIVAPKKAINPPQNIPLRNQEKPKVYRSNQGEKENIGRPSNNGLQRPKDRVQSQQNYRENISEVLKNKSNMRKPDLEEIIWETPDERRNFNSRKKAKILLDDMADDIDDMFKETKEREPPKQQKFVRSNIKDQMFEDLDNI